MHGGNSILHLALSLIVDDDDDETWNSHSTTIQYDTSLWNAEVPVLGINLQTRAHGSTSIIVDDV
jgi:hypothetical protein